MDYPQAHCKPQRWLLFAILLLLNGVAMLGDVQAQSGCTLACNSNVQVSLDQTGLATITVGLIAPNTALNCPNSLSITVFDAQNNPISPTLNCTYLNQTLPVRVTHTVSGNVCFGSVVLKDRLAPALTAPLTDKFIACNGDTSVLAVGRPRFKDNCTDSASLIYTKVDAKSDLPCYTVVGNQTVTARVRRTWTVTDASGNSSTFQENIYFRRNTLSSVTYPPSRDGFGAPVLSCDQDPNDLLITGQPLVAGKPLVTGGDCELVVNKTDQIVQVCPPAGYKIFRTWTVTDFCASTFHIQVQVIEVKDIIPPQISPPADLTIGVQPNVCHAVMQLMQPSASDNCSTVTVTPSWSFGSGFGPFTQVPLGVHTVTYTATDACNNSKQATSKVTVVDNQAPFAVCKALVSASLPSSGSTLIYPNSLDNGSYDHCTTVTFSMGRDSVNFHPHDTITCHDAGKTIRMFMRAIDVNGNGNTCHADVRVNDHAVPQVQCPAAITLNCLQDPLNLNLTGQASATDNCGILSLVHLDTNLYNYCIIGTVNRSWLATDVNGNTSSCLQIITLQPLSGLTVVFPADQAIANCSNQAAYAPSQIGTPTWSGQHCGTINRTYQDDWVTLPSPACSSIYRKWTVIDECIYDPNNPSSGGKWEKTQKITIFDQTAPVITAPAQLTLSANRPDCKADVVLQPATAIDCSNQVQIINNSAFATTSGADASGVYPAGVHQVVFTATDGCGNSSTALLTITVRDLTPPTAICKPGQIVPLNNVGIGVLSALSVSQGSSDNCTPATQLQYKVSPDSFRCQHIGAQNVTLTVTDAEQNTATCQTYVLVQDPAGFCTAKTWLVSGDITNFKGAKVNEVPVHVSSPQNTWVAYSDAFGKYIEEDAPDAQRIVVRPQHNEVHINGVNTLDVLFLQRHILGLQPLATPYQQLSADVNNSKSITSSDIVEIRRLILGAIDTFSKVRSWRFLPEGHLFANPNNPFAGALPDSIVYPMLSGHQLATNFTAMKMGDVDGNANVTDTRGGNEEVPVEIRDGKFAEGELIELPITLRNWHTWNAFQLGLEFDAEYLRLDSILYPKSVLLGAFHTYQSANHLAISWDEALQKPLESDSVLVVLRLRSLKAGVLSESMSLCDGKKMQSEAYRLDQVGSANLRLVFSPSANATPSPALEVHSPAPNPFSERVALSCTTKFAGLAQLTITDPLGQVISIEPWQLHKGLNSKVLDMTVFPHTGVWFYTLRIDGMGGSFGGKLVFLTEE
jgi:hypothetical protein